MSEYFPEPKSFGERVENELDFSNYASKADLKNATGADASKQANLATKGDIADFVKKQFSLIN